MPEERDDRNDRGDRDDRDEPSRVLEEQAGALLAAAVYVPAHPLLRPAFAPRFERCVVCETDLGDLDLGLGHLVFKELRGDEIIVELAICHGCIDVLEQVYSDQTRRAIDSLFVASRWCERARERLRAGPPAWSTALDHCALTGEPRAGGGTCQVIGVCAGDLMQVSFFPYVIGAAGIRRLEAVVSRQSQANWDRFLGQNQGLPPELRHLLHVGGD